MTRSRKPREWGLRGIDGAQADRVIIDEIQDWKNAGGRTSAELVNDLKVPAGTVSALINGADGAEPLVSRAVVTVEVLVRHHAGVPATVAEVRAAVAHRMWRLIDESECYPEVPPHHSSYRMSVRLPDED